MPDTDEVQKIRDLRAIFRCVSEVRVLLMGVRSAVTAEEQSDLIYMYFVRH